MGHALLTALSRQYDGSAVYLQTGASATIVSSVFSFGTFKMATAVRTALPFMPGACSGTVPAARFHLSPKLYRVPAGTADCISRIPFVPLLGNVLRCHMKHSTPQSAAERAGNLGNRENHAHAGQPHLHGRSGSHALRVLHDGSAFPPRLGVQRYLARHAQVLIRLSRGDRLPGALPWLRPVREGRTACSCGGILTKE